MALIFKLLETRDDPAVVSRCLGVVKTHCESPEIPLSDLLQLLVLHCDAPSSAAACTVALAGIEVLSLRTNEPLHHKSRRIVIETYLLGRIAASSSQQLLVVHSSSLQLTEIETICDWSTPSTHVSRQELIHVSLSNLCWLGFNWSALLTEKTHSAGAAGNAGGC